MRIFQFSIQSNATDNITFVLNSCSLDGTMLTFNSVESWDNLVWDNRSKTHDIHIILFRNGIKMIFGRILNAIDCTIDMQRHLVQIVKSISLTAECDSWIYLRWLMYSQTKRVLFTYSSNFLSFILYFVSYRIANNNDSSC